MGPTQESLFVADYLIAKFAITTDRYTLAYSIMDAINEIPEDMGTEVT